MVKKVKKRKMMGVMGVTGLKSLEYEFVSQHSDRAPAERKAEKLYKRGVSVRVTSAFIEEGWGPFRHPALKWTVWKTDTKKEERPFIIYDQQSPKSRSKSPITKRQPRLSGGKAPRITPTRPRLKR